MTSYYVPDGHTHDPALHTHPGGSQAFPVGSVFISVVATNPATLFGYGTWSQIGQGRVLVGQDPGDTAFDVAKETGGAKTHTHAGHSAHTDHPALVHASATTPDLFTTNTAAAGVAPAAHAAQAHSAHSAHDAPTNLMPYLVAYFWERTA
jgi:hypothetical protein